MSEATDEQVFLTPSQAIAMLPDGEPLHTFQNPGGCLVGVDWGRSKLIDAIRKSPSREIGGVQCCAVNHGLVILVDDSQLFVECKEGTDYERANELDEVK